jgi:hypothetical protein
MYAYDECVCMRLIMCICVCMHAPDMRVCVCMCVRFPRFRRCVDCSNVDVDDAIRHGYCSHTDLETEVRATQLQLASAVSFADNQHALSSPGSDLTTAVATTATPSVLFPGAFVAAPPTNEAERIAKLRHLKLLDTPPDGMYMVC